MEIWDLYDEKREPLGKTHVRGSEFNDGEYYVCAEVWIVTPDGKLLIQQRHREKKLGGWWEVCGGGVNAGETTQLAAVREVQEELGIYLNMDEIKYFTTYQAKNYFMDLFIVKREIDVKDLRLQLDEVSDVKLVTQQEFEDLVKEGNQIVKTIAKRYEILKDELFER